MTPKTKAKQGRGKTGPESPTPQVPERFSVAIPKRKKEFEIDIFKGWCKCCGICSAFCPRECIRLDDEGSPFVENSSRCTGCGWCELHCPDFAISVHERKAKRAEPAED